MTTPLLLRLKEFHMRQNIGQQLITKAPGLNGMTKFVPYLSSCVDTLSQ